MRLTGALALLFGLAACSQSDSDNVMAASANALTPAQVDLALGPEIPNTAGDAVEPANEADVNDPTASENAVEAADTEDALDESIPDEPATTNADSEE